MHDILQFWWDLLALNMRKTVFLLRGRRGPAPCQMEGDSGVAFVTGCEACHRWNRAQHLRRVCPALVKNADGWRCSVDAASVRPYWGRALLYYGGAGLSLYLIITCGVYTWLHKTGYDIRYMEVAWPPAWSRFEAIRSRYYFAQAKTALAENRLGEASAALSIAYEYDPLNYEVGLTLAQLLQAGPAATPDRIFENLLDSHPDRAAATARIWGQSLLRRGDFPKLARLAHDRLLQEPAPNSAWLHALLFSTRYLHDTRLLTDLLSSAHLPAETRTLLQWEVAAKGDGVRTVTHLLTAPLTEDASHYARYYQLSFLIRTGEPQCALELLSNYGTKLPTNERVALTLAALEKRGDKDELLKQFSALLERNSGPEVVEILSAHLIRYPNVELLRRIAGYVARSPWAERPEGGAATTALLCAAAQAGEWTLVSDLRARLQRVLNAPLRSLYQLDGFFGSRTGQRQLGNLLPTLPLLPVETVYALFEQEEARARRQL